MDILEMHTLFRELGQQMGLQTVRAILPEEIDDILNAVIIEKVRAICIENTTIKANHILASDRLQVGNLNALSTLYNESTDKPYEPMLYLGISVKGEKKTYSCRLIDPVELENTLNDYCNTASKEYPIATFIDDTVRIYPEDVYNNSTIIYKYIKTPAKVSMPMNVSCDLPSYLHTEIVESAVSKFYRAVGYTSPTNNAN